MKHARILCLLLVVSLAGSAIGQAKPAAPAASPAPQAQPTPQAPPTMAAQVDREVTNIEKRLIDVAEAMPEDKYNFAPTGLNIPGSEGVRTFAQQVKHVATINFLLWGPLVGEKPPVDVNNGNGPDSMQSKAEIVKYLKDSYAVGHRAAQSLTAKNAMGLLPGPFGAGPFSRLYLATWSVAHDFDHYGQMVEYLRMNGILPPASRPAPPQPPAPSATKN
jgi:DinB superfamily